MASIFVEDLIGQTVNISGPTTVCPNNFHPSGNPNLNGHNYSAQAVIAGINASCSNWDWFIVRLSDDLEIDGGTGNTISGYNFTEPGEYLIRFFGTGCGLIFSVFGELLVTSRVKMPNPIKHVTAPSMCNPGQAYTYETDPALGLSDPACYYHYEYYWTAPSGWDINGSGNTYFGHDASPDIVAPANTPHGVYDILVQSTIPNGQPGPFPNNRFLSAPRTNTVYVGGPFSTSQITVSGTMAVCGGNTYTYTANVPGGHKNDYNYDWTYPSGWIFQYAGASTIQLYVPTNYTSYGAVRVSVNNGCGSSSYTGVTVFPCNYMGAGDFLIYPNPSDSGELNVEFIETKNMSEGGQLTEVIFNVELYDSQEKLVRTAESRSGKVNLDTNNLQPGTYFLHIHNGKEVLTKQIIVK